MPSISVENGNRAFKYPTYEYEIETKYELTCKYCGNIFSEENNLKIYMMENHKLHGNCISWCGCDEKINDILAIM